MTNHRSAKALPGHFDSSRRPIWLASKSPRRKRLLLEAGFAVRIIAARFDDTGLIPPPDLTIEAWAVQLAEMKAAAAASAPELPSAGLLLTADTLVELRGEVIGQPADRSDARSIIERLADARHRVITGVCLLDLISRARVSFFDEAQVDVGQIPEEEIEAYLETEAWQGKAGAYNLAERLDAGWPIRYHGDPTTIMGLPMERLSELLGTG